MTLDTRNSTSRPLLEVRDLCTYFPVRGGRRGQRATRLRAVDGVSFDIAEGQTFGLVGESGCGKTTLGRSILRLIEPTAGIVRFDGVDVLGASRGTLRRLRRDMQIVFQDPIGSLNPRMTIEQIVAEPLAVHRVGRHRQRHEQVARLIEQVGLDSSDLRRHPHELSGGQRQRVGIARAIALNPKFLVCDEAVSALDVSIQAQILNLLGDLRIQLGLTCLFIAHNLAVVRHFSERIAVMYMGRMVEMAATEDIIARPAHPYTKALLAAVPEPVPTVESTTRRSRAGEATGAMGRPSAAMPAAPSELPDPANPPPGCPYHPRCHYATDLCGRTRPMLRPCEDSTEGHLAACHVESVQAERAAIRNPP